MTTFLDTEDLRLLENVVDELLRPSHESRSASEIWTTSVELGWPAMMLAPDDGGLGGGATALGIIMKGVGRNPHALPYLSTAIAAALLTGDVHTPDGQKLVASIVDGKAVFGVALEEIFAAPDAIDLRLDASGSGGTISGQSRLVFDYAAASHLLVPVVNDRGAIDLAVVDRLAPGMLVSSQEIASSHLAHRITFADVAVDHVVTRPDMHERLEAGRELAIVGLCAEACGVMTELNRLTKDHLKTRQQFGLALSQFQVLQHRMVNMAIDEQQSLAIAKRAAQLCDARSPDRHRHLAAAKAFVNLASRRVAEACVQLHGGIGVTEEFIVGSYLRRILSIAATLGDADSHIETLAEIAGPLPFQKWPEPPSEVRPVSVAAVATA